MKNNQEYVAELCQSLSLQGKFPNVALIRGHANRPLLLPDVVKGLQRWKQNSQTFEAVDNSAKKIASETQLSLAHRVQRLEQQVADISAQLSALLLKKS